jgi:hypothetical protein
MDRATWVLILVLQHMAPPAPWFNGKNLLNGFNFDEIIVKIVEKSIDTTQKRRIRSQIISWIPIYSILDSRAKLGVLDF